MTSVDRIRTIAIGVVVPLLGALGAAVAILLALPQLPERIG